MVCGNTRDVRFPWHKQALLIEKKDGCVVNISTDQEHALIYSNPLWNEKHGQCFFLAFLLSYSTSFSVPVCDFARVITEKGRARQWEKLVGER